MKVREEMFKDAIAAGAARNLVLTMQGNQCNIRFSTPAGVRKGEVVTKRGEIKSYRLDTAVKLLKAAGVKSATIELSGMDEEQQELDV
jgi:hypothetical protein